jgi:endonuclease/exonuclease/phosphatase family metal-dependent hydrolase
MDVPKVDKLKIVTFNLAFNVMANKVQGTEAPLVKLCQTSYTEGGFACTKNAAKFLAQYDIFGLQEVNLDYFDDLKANIRAANPNAKFVFAYATYFGNWGVVIGFNQKVTGSAVELLKGLLPDNLQAPDHRAIQSLYFKRFDLLMINLHAPHDINLKKEIEIFGQKLKKSVVGDLTNLKVVVTGDFNDYTGKLLKQEVTILGHSVRIPESKLVKSCCTDSSYRYPGDYVMVNQNIKVDHYGFPQGYVRGKPLMSDHDPVVLITK